MEYLSIILGVFTVASILGTVAASFYGVRQKTIIATLRESNDAYKERNEQLESSLATISKQVILLEGRIKSLEAIKTPPIQPLIKLIEANEVANQQRHEALMAVLPQTKTRRTKQ